MEGWSKIIVRKANIICSAECDNFYCAGTVNFTMLAPMSEAFGTFRNTPPRVTDDARAARIADCGRQVESQYHEEVAHGRSSRMHGKCILWVVEYSTRNGSRAAKRQKSPVDGFFYVSLVAGKAIPVPTRSSLALDFFFYFLITYGICKKRKYCFFHSFLSTLMNIKPKQTNKKSSQKELWHFDFYRTGTIRLFTVLAREFLLC